MKKQIRIWGLLTLAFAFSSPLLAQSDSSDRDTIEEIEVIEDAEEPHEMIEEIMEEIADELEGLEKEVIVDGEKVRIIVKKKHVVTGSDGQDSTIEVIEKIEINGGNIEVQDGEDQVTISGEEGVQVHEGERHIVIGRHGEDHQDGETHERTKIVTIGMFNMQLGLNNTLNSSGELEMPQGYESLELSAGRSINFHLHFIQQALNIYRENIRLVYGIGIDFNNYRFQNDILLGRDSMGVLNTEVNPDVSYKKNKLATQYLTMPLLLNFQFGHAHEKKFKVSVGANFGYLINSYQKLKWKDHGTQKSKIKDDFNLVKFRTGYEVQFGYGSFVWYIKYFPESMFKANEGPELRSVSAGILIGSI